MDLFQCTLSEVPAPVSSARARRFGGRRAATTATRAAARTLATVPPNVPAALARFLRFCGGHGRRVEVAEARAVKRPPEFGALSGKHRQPARGWGDTVVVVGRHRALVERSKESIEKVAKKHSKIIQQSAKFHPKSVKSVQNLSKIDPKTIQTALGRGLGPRRAPRTEKQRKSKS